MNFKLNLWTLLFACTAVALFYFMYTSDSQDQGPCPCPTPPPSNDQIPVDTFNAEYGRYKARCLAKLDSLNSQVGVVNMDIQYVTLAANEIEQLYFTYLANKKPEIRFYPVLKGFSSVSDTLDYVFGMKDTTDQMLYFDFTRPCPTLCRE